MAAARARKGGRGDDGAGALLPALLLSALPAPPAAGEDGGAVVPGFFTGRIRATFEEIGSLPPEEFPRRLPGLRARVDRFIEHQKNICQGEFSTVVLDEFGEGAAAAPAAGGAAGGAAGEGVLRKLDPDERKLCFRELQSIRVAFISSVHRARRAYLVHVHKRELEGLDALRDEAVQSVQKSFLNL